MGEYNPSGVRPYVNDSNANGRAVLEKAESYLGTVESPALSDTGTHIDRWNSFFSATAIPWAGSFVTGMYHEANVRDDGIGDPNPKVMYDRAVQLGRIAQSPIPGCFVVFGTFDADGNMLVPYTVEIFGRWEDLQAWTIITIGGNLPIGSPVTNHGVQIKARNAWLPDPNNHAIQLRFIAPSSIVVHEGTTSRYYDN